MGARLIIGDVFEALATLEDASVDLVVTSPPFLALRSYLPALHPLKPFEIGSEATPGEYLDVLLDVVEACSRVLAPHGSIAFELGDTYAGSGGAGGDYGTKEPGEKRPLREGQPKYNGSALAERRTRNANRLSGEGLAGGGRSSRPDDAAAGLTHPRSRPGPEGRDFVDGWPLDKSAALIPQLFAIALSYGLNPLTGRRTDRWRVRNVVAWCRPNPPVGADGDKFRRATTYVTIATRARDRYWDGYAVRRPGSAKTNARVAKGVESRPNNGKAAADERGGGWATLDIADSDGTAPLLDYWELSTQPYKGSHYATFPEALVVPLVQAMCPERVCRTCGEPSRRIVGPAEYVNSKNGKPVTTLHFDGDRRRDGENHWDTTGKGDRAATRVAPTLGWTDCGHGTWRPGVVLDPFAGSGTTLQVATRLGRGATGIDLDGRNEDLVRQRVGLFLAEVDHLAQAPRLCQDGPRARGARPAAQPGS